MAAGSDSKSLAQAPPETQGVDLNRNFGVQFGDSAGHPAFVEDNWIAKADQHKDEFKVEEMIQIGDDPSDAVDSKNKQTTSDPRSMFFTGKAAFSEPES